MGRPIALETNVFCQLWRRCWISLRVAGRVVTVQIVVIAHCLSRRPLAYLTSARRNLRFDRKNSQMIYAASQGGRRRSRTIV